MLASDKTISGNGIDGLLKTLENRVVELFGGQIAEDHVCGTNDKDDVWFELEDTALEIFKNQAYRDAILPIATFLNDQVEAGATEINGALIDAELNKHLPDAPKKKTGLGGFFGGR